MKSEFASWVPREGYPVESLQEAIYRLLRESGAEPPPIRVEKVESLRRGPLVRPL